MDGLGVQTQRNVAVAQGAAHHPLPLAVADPLLSPSLTYSTLAKNWGYTQIVLVYVSPSCTHRATVAVA